MAGQRQRQQRHQRAGEQHRRPRPAQHRHARRWSRPPRTVRSSATRPRCRPGWRPTRYPTGSAVSLSGWPVTSETVSGTSSTAHTAHTPEASRAQCAGRGSRRRRGRRCVCGGTRNAANRNDADGEDRRDLARRPDERQPVGGDGTGVGQPGRGQRVGERQRAQRRAATAPASTATPTAPATPAPVRTPERRSRWSSAQGMAAVGR